MNFKERTIYSWTRITYKMLISGCGELIIIEHIVLEGKRLGWYRVVTIFEFRGTGHVKSMSIDRQKTNARL